MAGENVAIVQARMGSKRFPGKMLARLGDSALLEWVLKRVQTAFTIDGVVLATSTSPADDALAKVAEQLDISVFRGSETDVVGRYVEAAHAVGAINVVRVCADNPFVDGGEIDRLIKFFRASSVDYAFNHRNRLGSQYADGFGAEILSTRLLADIADETRKPEHREHVTLFLWDNRDRYRLGAVPAPQALARPDLRFDIDTVADLEHLDAFVREHSVTMATSAAQIVAHAATSSAFLQASEGQSRRVVR